MSTRFGSLALLAALVFGSPSLCGAATITIVNKDAAGVGFNDPTPAVPVGGNAGITLGQQRLNVFQSAAAIWGAKLNSAITIKIAADFGPLTPCSSGSGVLGFAGPTTFYENFTNAPKTNTWYPVALASALSGTDLAAGLTDGASIEAHFNSNIGTVGCLTGTSWYLGLDANHGLQVDLLTVLLHEFGHGLGFTGLVDTGTGAFANDGTADRPDTFAFSTFDNSVLLRWTNMSNAQRLTSMINTGNVVFDGTNATAGAATILTVGKDGANHPKLFTPNPLQQGSSIYHFDTTASPNLLMEPIINSDLTHNVDAPNDLSAKVMYDIGWTAPVSLAPPTNVIATATTAGAVNVAWSTAAGATSYKVYRSANGTNWTLAGSPTTNAFSESPGSGAYLYKVHSFDGSVESSDSNLDFATAFTFTDPSVTTGTTVKAAHITELRTAADLLRSLAGLGGGTYADSITGGVTAVRAVHITDIRTAIDQARAQLSALGFIPGLGGGSYSTGVTTGSTIGQADINDLRAAIR